MAQPPIHVEVYGESGSGKSTFAATAPKPMRVHCFDPHGKDTPYLKRGEPMDLGYHDDGTPYRDVISRRTGESIIRLEYFHDAEPTEPTAYARYLRRMSVLHHEYDQIATLVTDSGTFMELVARKWHQYKLNPTAKEARQWFGGSTDLLEEMVLCRFGALPINIVMICHVDEDKDEVHGEFVRNPKLPGRLRKASASGFGEFYYAYVTIGEDGNPQYLLQTRKSSRFNASTQINAPDPCAPTWQALYQGQGG